MLTDKRRSLNAYPEQQTIFLKLIQQGLEEGKALSPLKNYIDQALELTASNRCLSKWFTVSPSLFQQQLQLQRKTIEFIENADKQAKPHRQKIQDYGALHDGASEAVIDMPPSCEESKQASDENTRLLAARSSFKEKPSSIEVKQEDHHARLYENVERNV